MRNKVKRFKISLIAIAAGLLIIVAPQALMARSANSPANDLSTSANTETSNTKLAKQVRHQLLMLPYYGVFDNLAYSIEGDKVTLHGQVVNPSTRSDAARSVARIDGVSEVINNIQVLPLSGFDDSIRVNTYRALTRTAGLYRYFMGTNPSLHIVVENGHLTLTGVVSNKMDQRLAYITASSVPGVFSVTNDLQVDGDNKAR